jgi:hypothetical protein
MENFRTWLQPLNLKDSTARLAHLEDKSYAKMGNLQKQLESSTASEVVTKIIMNIAAVFAACTH